MENEKEEIVEVVPLKPTLVEEPTETGLDIKIRRTESLYAKEKEIKYEMKWHFNCNLCHLLTEVLCL